MSKGTKSTNRGRTKPKDLRPGEIQEGQWAAGLPYERLGGRIPRATGRLFLTDRRLVFDPVEEDARRPKNSSSRTWGVFAAEKSLGMKIDRGTGLLDDISRVEEIPGEHPLMRVVMKDGTEVKLSFQERLFFNPPGRGRRARNRLVRDDALRCVAAALEARQQDGTAA